MTTTYGSHRMGLIAWDVHTDKAGEALSLLSKAVLLGLALTGALVLSGFGEGSPLPPFDHQWSVFGDDDRRELTKTGKPWSAIGRIELHPEGVVPSKFRGNIPICTGSLVWKDLVLTNAHCVLDSLAAGAGNKVVWFRPGYRRGRRSDEVRAVNVWVGSTSPNKNRSDDWAIIQLERAIGVELGWLDVRAYSFATTAEESRYSMAFVGYASDFAAGGVPSHQVGCSITAYDASYDYLRHDCDMNSGSSGGPLVQFDGEEAHIVAINAAHTGRKHNSYFPEFSPERANIAVSVDKFFPTLQKLKGELMPLVEAPPPELGSEADASSAVKAKGAPAN